MPKAFMSLMYAGMTLFLCLFAQGQAASETDTAPEARRILQKARDVNTYMWDSSSKVMSYQDGSLSVQFPDGTETGRFRDWWAPQNRHRSDWLFGESMFSYGCDGMYLWQIKIGGNLVVDSSYDGQASTRIDSLLEVGAHLDEDDSVFVLSYEGTEPLLSGGICYVVTVANKLTPRILMLIIDTALYVERKVQIITEDSFEIWDYSDFREVGGIINPFSISAWDSKTGIRIEKTVDRIIHDLDMISEVFDPILASQVQSPTGGIIEIHPSSESVDTVGDSLRTPLH